MGSLGNIDAAEMDRKAAMEIPPRDADDWVTRGVWRLAESPENALDDFEQALLKFT